LRGHRQAALALDGTSRLYNAMRKHGTEKFAIHLIRNDAINYKELADQEVAEIQFRDTLKNGYNISRGGSIGTGKSIIINGEKFVSYASAAEFFDIDAGLFNSRINAGKSPEEAAGLIEPDKPYSYEIIIGDKVYPSLQKACDAQNISYKAVWNRINKYEWTLMQALEIETPPESYANYKTGIAIKVGDKQFRSCRDLARFLDISPAVITKRYRGGQTFQSIYDHFKDGGGRRLTKKAA
jgi:hypothetical protein